ncbi:hypothetical protein EVAR_3429_1 [Eumeta japonica]|uniref:Uncharacterized protein n=1 Tax=Eumeta variegata TaxID=151549 RepID=A0A4C1SVN0_EUMVA|nr:hypothetical protein EVAR_3429_1 [Eumeta japonica]
MSMSTSDRSTSADRELDIVARDALRLGLGGLTTWLGSGTTVGRRWLKIVHRGNLEKEPISRTRLNSSRITIRISRDIHENLNPPIGSRCRRTDDVCRVDVAPARTGSARARRGRGAGGTPPGRKHLGPRRSLPRADQNYDPANKTFYEKNTLQSVVVDDIAGQHSCL